MDGPCLDRSGHGGPYFNVILHDHITALLLRQKYCFTVIGRRELKEREGGLFGGEKLRLIDMVACLIAVDLKESCACNECITTNISVRMRKCVPNACCGTLSCTTVRILEMFSAINIYKTSLLAIHGIINV